MPIKQILVDRKIPCLVHFTNINNLVSILDNGLYPVSELSSLECGCFKNDEYRFDGHSDSVSLSVAFPNCQMFYRIVNNCDDKYCFIALSPRLILNYECAYCRQNAADGTISCQSLDELKKSESFSGMFDEIEGFRSREDQKLKACDPTDVQAEILVFGKISPSYIFGVVFPDNESKDEYINVLSDKKAYVHSANQGFYGTRTYSREY